MAAVTLRVVSRTTLPAHQDVLKCRIISFFSGIDSPQTFARKASLTVIILHTFHPPREGSPSTTQPGHVFLPPDIARCSQYRPTPRWGDEQAHHQLLCAVLCPTYIIHCFLRKGCFVYGLPAKFPVEKLRHIRHDARKRPLSGAAVLARRSGNVLWGGCDEIAVVVSTTPTSTATSPQRSIIAINSPDGGMTLDRQAAKRPSSISACLSDGRKWRVFSPVL